MNQKNSPFDFLKEIYNKKNSFTPEEIDKGFVPYLMNQHFSYFKDSVLIANEVNQMNNLPKYLQFLFLLNIIGKQKPRFTSFDKSEVEDTNVEVVKEYYGYSTEKALQVLPLLNQEQLQKIKVKVDSKYGKRS